MWALNWLWRVAVWLGVCDACLFLLSWSPVSSELIKAPSILASFVNYTTQRRKNACYTWKQVRSAVHSDFNPIIYRLCLKVKSVRGSSSAFCWSSLVSWRIWCDAFTFFSMFSCVGFRKHSMVIWHLEASISSQIVRDGSNVSASSEREREDAGSGLGPDAVRCG